MQTASSRIWTYVTNFISNDDNRYATKFSKLYKCLEEKVKKYIEKNWF